ncbi:DNA-directed RNA polymerase subunit beta' [Kosmotoga olearia]|uniref:DNA-directed RNA polymerase subunit beta' n=2 Tax=Kosmotoga TaxID=651456 RepID=C5CGD8_KOSOT|nr:DNA-directed RNA polymerase subunit beta' [Kosmotoga olearia]ACR80519.1 DNA-directed RNA polymerase, beta' subunit [Kosmotoga olearia TBF 19.5.1]
MAISTFNRKISTVQIKIASPERIRSWSSGEVKKPETINYRTFKPERDGLFCEKIFGPTKDYECACGKYKGKKYEGTICERCGVRVESKEARRRRIGHIELAAPVVHVWYLKSAPSILASLLNIPSKDLENIIYYGSKRVIEKLYVVTDPKGTDFFPGQTLYQTEYDIYSKKWDFDVEQGYKIRSPRGPVIAEIDGKVKIENGTGNTERELNWIIIEGENGITKKYPIFEGGLIYVQDGDEVRQGDTLADRFLFEDEVLSEKEFKIFEEYYPGKFESETDTESDRPIVIVTKIDEDVSKETGLKVGDIIIENEYDAYKEIYPGKIECDYGALAIQKLLRSLDLEELKIQIEHELKGIPKSSARALKLLRRLKFVKDFLKSGNKPEWIVLEALPVIPPELRPMIQIEGGRFATTDLNDLYRRVINRNNRLAKLLSIGAPDIIVRNEKRMLQEAVDSLIYNGRVGKAVTDKSGRPLKSLTDLVKGKKGRFRRNLLGKRVDYSGRAVIVVGPDLKIHECGIPKRMAMELFKPFVLGKLLHGSESSKTARKLKKTIIEKEMPEAWEVLEDVIKGHPVLLNRAPTLHRISIQAFIPRLVEGNAIQLHPLVCAPFNADFDGDQMAVHVPLSAAAQAEAKFLMLSRYNVISPANGKPISMPGKDIIVGVYYLTTVDHEYKVFEEKLNKYQEELKSQGIDGVELRRRVREKALEKINWKFSSEAEALLAYDIGIIKLHEPILVKLDENKGDLTLTTVGRIIFNAILPEDLKDYSTTFGKKAIKNLIYRCFQEYGIDRTADLLDDMMRLGFHYATISGLTISIRDIVIYPEKDKIIEEARKKVDKIEDLYRKGFLNELDRSQEIIKIWEKTTEELMRKTFDEFKKYPFNPVFMMVDSGARGNIDQLKQLAGMRGLMADPSGKTIEVPIISNFRDGLTELEFFTSTHGARKGSADTALRTSFAGYLTRRLVDVAQGVTITTPDCGTSNGIEAFEMMADDVTIEKLEDFIFGRVLAEDVIDPETNEVLKNPVSGKEYIRDTMIRDEDAKFVASFRKTIPVKKTEKVNLNEVGHFGYYAELAEDVEIGDKEFKAGTQLTSDILHELKTLEVGEVMLDIYPAVGKVYVGPKFRDKNGTVLVKYQEKIDVVTAKKLVDNGFTSVEVRPVIKIRSVLTCDADHGVCAMCYGMDLSNHEIVNVGEAVGIVAAQSIGEPGTQLTMRTFHTGGIATGADITRGLPRAEELFEARKKLKDPEALFAEEEGIVKDIATDEKGRKKIYIETLEGKIKEHDLSTVIKPRVEVGDKVLKGESLTTGTIRPRKLMEKLGVIPTAMYLLMETKRVYAEQGVEIHDKHFELIIRQMLSMVEVVDPGSTDYLPGDLLSLQDVKKINREILEDNKKVEENREYVIGRRLARRILDEDEEGNVTKIAVEGEPITEELMNKIIETGIKEITIYDVTEDEYQKLLEEIDPELVIPQKTIQINPKETIKYRRRLLRITKASLESHGWLSAASFQQTPQVLTEASVEGKVDYLLGLKENVIVGQLIPAGTGLDMYANIQIEEAREVTEEAKDVG